MLGRLRADSRRSPVTATVSRSRLTGAGRSTYRERFANRGKEQTMSTVELRHATQRDRPRLLELNAASVQELSPLDEPRLGYILALAHSCLVAERGDGELVGFAIAVAPGADYDSKNYKWLAERYERFLYLDRIAVDVACRRQGVGARLYDAMEAAAAQFERMVCDVNIAPRNDASLAFHGSRGYREVGELAHGSAKTVVLMSKELAGT
jgi:predicted GNAT superfamily acetyltransferase